MLHVYVTNSTQNTALSRLWHQTLPSMTVEQTLDCSCTYLHAFLDAPKDPLQAVYRPRSMSAQRLQALVTAQHNQHSTSEQTPGA